MGAGEEVSCAVSTGWRGDSEEITEGNDIVYSVCRLAVVRLKMIYSCLSCFLRHSLFVLFVV